MLSKPMALALVYNILYEQLSGHVTPAISILFCSLGLRIDMLCDHNGKKTAAPASFLTSGLASISPLDYCAHGTTGPSLSFLRRGIAR